MYLYQRPIHLCCIPGSTSCLISVLYPYPHPDPDGVLNLIQSALSMEKLSTLLSEDQLQDHDLLPQVQNRLEGEGLREPTLGGREGGGGRPDMKTEMIVVIYMYLKHSPDYTDSKYI